MTKKIKFSSLSYKELEKNIKKQNTILSFIDTNSVYHFHSNKEYKESLLDKTKNRICLIDGIGPAIALSIKNLKIIKRTMGPIFTDLFLKNQSKNKKHFFIGIKNKDGPKLIKNYPNLKTKNIGCYNPPYIKKNKFSSKEIQKISNKIKKFNPDYVWVGLGCPKQEILANQLTEKVSVKCVFNVGAAIDYIISRKNQAPRYIRKLGLEWLYRLFTNFERTSKKIKNIFLGLILAFFITDLKKSNL